MNDDSLEPDRNQEQSLGYAYTVLDVAFIFTLILLFGVEVFNSDFINIYNRYPERFEKVSIF